MAGQHGEAVFDELPVFREGRALQDAVAAITFVVEERMSLPGHVDAYLVRAARFEPAFDQRHIAVTFQHPPVGHGVLAVRPVFEYEHLLPVAGAAADVARDRPLVLVEIAPHECHITALDCMVEELLGQPCVRLFVLGHHEQPRRVLVDAVHQPGAHVALLEQGQVAQVVRERVYECTAVISVPGMHHQPGGLVDDQQVVVLVGNFERDIFGDDLHFAPRVGHHDLDTVERLDLVARFRGLAVHEDVAAVGSRLDTVARAFLHAYGQELVQPQRGLPLVGYDRKVLIQPGSLAVLFRGFRSLVEFGILLYVAFVGHQSKNPSSFPAAAGSSAGCSSAVPAAARSNSA